MKCCRRARWRLGLLLAATLAAVAHADLARWVQEIDSASALRAVFFRSVPLPSGPVNVRRTPRETREGLTRLLAARPNDPELLALRAREAEQQLDLDAAEADWKQSAQASADKAAGYLALADFYRRRLKPRDEIAALATVAAQPSPASERLVPPERQRSWRAFERMFAVIEEQAMPAEDSVAQYRAWMARYPREAQVYRRFFDFLVAQKDFTAAAAQIEAYRKAFPDDTTFPVRARAALAHARGAEAEALAVYESSYQPLWPPELVQNYFSLLTKTRNLRTFLDRARSGVAADPDDLNAATRLFYYYQQQGNLAAARRALVEYRLRKESRNASWTAQQLWVMARLFEGVLDYDEAARHYYALYSLPAAADADRETALAGILRVLFDAPEHPVRFGAGDLSFYKDVATMDPAPGFLNGILSLILNSTEPEYRYAEQERLSVAYFHRARAAELMALFESRFPQSAERAPLRARLIEAYAQYGDADAVIAAARRFLADLPDAAERTRVSLLLAEAYSRSDRVQEEFATYDALLAELAAKAGNVPLGENATALVRTSEESDEGGEQPREGGTAGPRSPEYARVLERYIARLLSRKETRRVLTLYRREIDRNPDDPGLYERLAAFLEANRFGADVEQTYRRAMQQFPDRSWHHKLARWYLRSKRQADFEKLTQEVAQVFTGSELEAYFRDVVAGAGLGPQLYLRVNQYAHQRFPYSLAFVRNLLSAYHSKDTYDHAAWQQLIREFWFYSDDLRARFFEDLVAYRKMESELAAALAYASTTSGARWPELARQNPAAARFLGEAAAWQSHFEAAAPLLGALADEHPGDLDLSRRAAAIHRSLAAYEPAHTEAAASIEERIVRFDPRDREALARVGDVYADRDQLARARPWWERMAHVAPGKPEGYLEAATVFWDYYQFDEALRMMEEGRRKLGRPALYAYEAGAVYENKRDYRRALQQYLQGALADPYSPAWHRLLALARRPAFRQLADEVTARAVALPDPSQEALNLRVAVLETQDRRIDIEKMLQALVETTASIEMLERIEGLAERQDFHAVRARSLERRIALTGDPVERLRLRLALARFRESRRDVEAARREIESLYADNPRVLGVVRATVDFHWRNQDAQRALQILEQAAAASHPALRRQFQFEAARKATEAGQFAHARKLLEPLLRDDPFQSEYLTAVADTFARAGDDAGLRDFYVATIEAMRSAPLAPAERTARIAALRRGLILALTRLKNYAFAVDQYIEILNRYPEDAGLAAEAARYAQEHDRKQQLLDYYRRAERDSPRDFRWPTVTARLEAQFEDFPAAIEAYTRATRIRPDRSDLYLARAQMEERLMRFDEALVDYRKLYDLTYQDAQWMRKVAELHARRSEIQPAVEALRKALIEGRPERPQTFFETAEQLDAWNLPAEARAFAERGVELAGKDLLRDNDYLSGAQTYARVMIRLRQHEALWKRLAEARQAGGAENTASSYQAVLRQLGQTLDRYYAPEERAAFAAFLEAQKAAASRDDLERVLVPLAQDAVLPDLEARWRHELMMSSPGSPESQVHYGRLVQLQRRRFHFSELAAQLEAYERVFPHNEGKGGILDQAADAWRDAGNADAEFRVLRARYETWYGGPRQERYYEFLLERDPQRLVTLAAMTERPPWFRDSVADFAVRRAPNALALDVIAARGGGLPQVWTRAYTGLAGLYRDEKAPRVRESFLAALGGGAIGERVGRPVDRNQTLAGDLWFYYGSRYGEYQWGMKAADTEDYLPAMLEGTPANTDAYFTLAGFYRDTRQWERALADYDHALELSPRRGEAHLEAARILWQQDRDAEALERLRAALVAFDHQQNTSGYSESFWPDVEATFEELGRKKLLPALRGEANQLLHNYVRRNGSYRADPLLRGALAAAGDPAAGTAWVLELSRVAPSSSGFLNDIRNARWIPETGREAIYRRTVELAEKELEEAHGPSREYAIESLNRARLRLAAQLARQGQPQAAHHVLESISKAGRAALLYELAPVEIRVAALGGKLADLFARYRSQPDEAPPLEALRNAALALRSDGQAATARQVLEFAYSRELENYSLEASNFLGLAEIRLEQGDTPGALELLRRMTLIGGAPFENLEPAAALLARFGRHAEAAEFRSQRVRAVPWDAEARSRQAESLLAASGQRDPAFKLLASVVQKPSLPYGTRVAAARAWERADGGPLDAGATELTELAKKITPDSGVFFGWFDRLLQAGTLMSSPSSRIKPLEDALAIRPDSHAARLALARAAVEAGRHRLLLVALEPYREAANLGREADTGYGMEADSSEGRAAEEEPRPISSLGDEEFATEYSQERYEAGRWLAGLGLEDGARADLAHHLAVALEAQGQHRAARRFVRIALYLQADDAARRPLRASLERLNAELRRQAANQRRQPKISPNLEQENLVRPRLAAAAYAAGKGGRP
ncbi:MAG TPA: hypothetical protein VNK82_00675 [Terriglobales bacterium]|nr:hypothetical protein [Terriglobales bacterium]